MCNEKYLKKFSTKQAMATCLLCFICITFTVTLHCIVLLPGQLLLRTRLEIWAAQPLQRTGASIMIPLLLPWIISITDFYSISLPIPFHIQTFRIVAEGQKHGTNSWPENSSCSFIISSTAVQKIYNLVSKSIFQHCKVHKLLKKKSKKKVRSWRKRGFILGLPRSIEPFSKHLYWRTACYSPWTIKCNKRWHQQFTSSSPHC